MVSITAFASPLQFVTIYWSPTLGSVSLFFSYHHKEVAVACLIPLTTNSAQVSASFSLSQK